MIIATWLYDIWCHETAYINYDYYFLNNLKYFSHI